MFVHAREHDNPSNMRYMGLTLGKYIPDVGKAAGDTWEGAFTAGPINSAFLYVERAVGCCASAQRRRPEGAVEAFQYVEHDLSAMCLVGQGLHVGNLHTFCIQHGNRNSGSSQFALSAGVVHEQDMLRQSLHELIIDPLLGSAMPSQVQLLSLVAKRCISNSALVRGFTASAYQSLPLHVQRREGRPDVTVDMRIQ
jgi:hypothetical protein